MQALVTGGTGFLGNALVRSLLTQGTHVRVLTRSPGKATLLADQGAEPLVGDITDKDVLGRALQDTEVVYHLAGRLFAPGVPADEYHRIHVEGTRVLLACCHKVPGLRRVVHVSTTGVLGVTGPQPADESAPHAPTNAYERTKWQAEVLVGQALRGGLPAVVVRPGLVYGPGDLHLLGLFRAIQRGFFRPIGSRPIWLHPIFIDDMTEALLRCGQHPRAVGECFHIAGQRPVTVATLAERIAIALGTRPPRGTIPLPAARAVAVIADLLPAGLKAFAPLTRSRLDFLTHSRVYNVAKVEQALGFVATTDLSDGLTRTVAWYRRHGYLPAARQSGWRTTF